MGMQLPMDELRTAFGQSLQENVSMANYTTARVGGAVPALISIHTLDDLTNAARTLWHLEVPFSILGSGSNILVSDKGLDRVILHNRAHNLMIDTKSDSPSVTAESGAILGTVARQTALRGLSGMEWAAPVPGTVGGAVYGNAGAHDGDMARSLKMAKILHAEQGIEDWPVEKLAYQYRSSILKREKMPVVILSAIFKVVPTSREEAWEKISAFQAHRKQTQPPGASMGSMFKNPPGDFAGRLIEAAGLKGKRAGRAIISPTHANFIVNLEGATAQDIYTLMTLARETVEAKFGITLEPEIELIGEFD
jgi:UDP-N-acetylmuramate dehydrogenase